VFGAVLLAYYIRCTEEISEEVFNNWYATLHNLETDVDQMAEIRGMIRL
jgi:hypothetical protein